MHQCTMHQFVNVPMYQYALEADPPSANCSLRTEAAILLPINHMISKLESLVPQVNTKSEPNDSPDEYSRKTGFSGHSILEL